MRTYTTFRITLAAMFAMIRLHHAARIGLAMQILCLATTVSEAQLGPGSQTVEDVVFDQIVTILPNSLGIPEGSIPVSTLGSFTVTWAAESMGEAQVTEFVGTGSGAILPEPGPFMLDMPGMEPEATFNGNLSNIVSAPSGELTSGDLALNVTFSAAFTDPEAGGLTLYTKDTSFFFGPLSGASNVGSVYTDPMNGDTDIYTIIPGLGEILIGESSNRIMTVVPEPTSWILLLLSAPVIGLRRVSAT